MFENKMPGVLKDQQHPVMTDSADTELWLQD